MENLSCAICFFISRFIERYGTHVIVGVKMGGKDAIYMKQLYSSPLQPADIQKKLKDMADKMFIERRSSEKSNTRNKVSRTLSLYSP